MNVWARFTIAELQQIREQLSNGMDTLETRIERAKSLGMTQFQGVLEAERQMMYERGKAIDAELDKRALMNAIVKHTR